jgi:hypothetical protein
MPALRILRTGEVHWRITELSPTHCFRRILVRAADKG